jgi:hypothetical protein
MNEKKPPLAVKERAGEQPVTNDTQRPKNQLANVLTTKPKPLSTDVSATRPKNPSAKATKEGKRPLLISWQNGLRDVEFVLCVALGEATTHKVTPSGP